MCGIVDGTKFGCGLDCGAARMGVHVESEVVGLRWKSSFGRGFVELARLGGCMPRRDGARDRKGKRLGGRQRKVEVRPESFVRDGAGRLESGDAFDAWSAATSTVGTESEFEGQYKGGYGTEGGSSASRSEDSWIDWEWEAWLARSRTGPSKDVGAGSCDVLECLAAAAEKAEMGDERLGYISGSEIGSSLAALLLPGGMDGPLRSARFADAEPDSKLRTERGMSAVLSALTLSLPGLSSDYEESVAGTDAGEEWVRQASECRDEDENESGKVFSSRGAQVFSG